MGLSCTVWPQITNVTDDRRQTDDRQTDRQTDRRLAIPTHGLLAMSRQKCSQSHNDNNNNGNRQVETLHKSIDNNHIQISEKT